MKRTLFLLPVLLGTSLAAVREASACSIANCQPPVRLFPANERVAANLIRFKVTTPLDPGPLELRAADGSVVPARITMMGADRVFAPDTTPAADQKLTLHYRPTCFRPEPTNPSELTFTFDVSSVDQMDLGPSSLTVTEKGILFSGAPTGHSVAIHFEHRLPDRAWAARHLTDTTWTIAGRPFWSWVPGAVVTNCSPPSPEWRPDSCGSYGHIPPGKHLLKAVSRIVGLDQAFVAELEVDTSCDQVLSIGPYTPPDGGPADVGGHEANAPREGTPVNPINPPIDAGVADGPAITGGSPSPTTAACALSPIRAPVPWGSLGLLLATIGWLVRRRR
jgi:hypothetical protein